MGISLAWLASFCMRSSGIESGLPLRGSPAPRERADVFVGGSHTLSKRERQSITLLPGLGIEGDAHCGSTLLSDRKKYPTAQTYDNCTLYRLKDRRA